MTTHLELEKGKELPLNFAAGTMITFKSGIFDLRPGGNHETRLDFFNQDGDMTLRISFRRGHNRVFFNDRSQTSLVDGWGQERSVSLRPTDVDKWRRLGVLISVHDCSTPSSVQYQILFDLTIVHYFNRRFPGPAVKVAYEEILPSGKKLFFNRRCLPQLSDPLETSSYTLEDLPASERDAIESGRVPLAIPAPVPTEIYIPLPQFGPGRPWACHSWNNGKEMRIYHLGPGNILNDYVYSAHRNEWKRGKLQDRRIVLDPASSLAASAVTMPYRDACISVYYQDLTNDMIYVFLDTLVTPASSVDAVAQAAAAAVVAAASAALTVQLHPTTHHHSGWPVVARAVKGSSIATLYDTSRPRVFYQDPGLCLRECVYDPLTGNYIPGEFQTGPQPHGTPITAEVVHGGAVGANVMWKDANGLPLRSSWSESSGWDVPIRVNPRIRRQDGRG